MESGSLSIRGAVRKFVHWHIHKICTTYCVTFQHMFLWLKCNALGPAFLQSSDSIAEELLVLLFQPAICCAGNVFPLKIATLHGGSRPLVIHDSLGPPESIYQTASRFAGLKIATDPCLTLPYLQGGWVLATQRWGRNRTGPMRMIEITARLREPLWGSDEPYKSMWLDTAKFVWPQEMISEDGISSHDGGCNRPTDRQTMLLRL